MFLERWWEQAPTILLAMEQNICSMVVGDAGTAGLCLFAFWA